MLKRLLPVGAERQRQGGDEDASSANKIAAAAGTLQAEEDELATRRQHVERRIEAEQQNARRQLAQGDKPAALECLRRKKMLEAEVERIDVLAMRVVEQRSMIESQASTLAVVSSLQQAAATAKENLKAADVEKVEHVTDDIETTTQDMEQLHQAFAAPSGAAASVDEDELMDQLDAFDQEDAKEGVSQARKGHAAVHAPPQASKGHAAVHAPPQASKAAHKAAAAKLAPARRPAAEAGEAAPAAEAEAERRPAEASLAT